MTYVIDKGTELGMLVKSYQDLDESMQRRLLGYMEALIEQQKEKKENTQFMDDPPCS